MRTHETPFASPWRFQMPEAGRRQKMQAIVTFAIRSTRLEGQLKFSQHLALADQRRVTEALPQSPIAVIRDVGALLQQRQAARRK